MEIKLYNYAGYNTVINKTLSNETVFDGILYTATDITTPVIEVQSTMNLFLYNYAYISDFQRYYFINSISITDTNFYKMTLREDVLKTYEGIIKNVYGVVTTSKTESPYDSTFDTQHDVRPTVKTYDFENNFNEDGSIIMVTLRG